MTSSRLFPIFLGLLVATMGFAFAYWMWTGYRKVAATYEWPVVPCTIMHSAIVEDTRVPNAVPDYRIDVLYQYEFAGETRTSERVRTRVRRVKETEKLEGFFNTIPVGTRTVCYVNPADPDFAILQRDTKAALYTIWFPGLFIVGGLGMTIAAIRRK
jgi:Protein of unknown function (DUF3592)